MMDKETELILKEMTEAISKAVKPDDDISKPFQQQTENKEKFIVKPSEAKNITKKLEPFYTDTFLDKLFLNSKEESIGGLPFGIQLGVTGLPASGKSILIEELAVRVANMGKHVLLITSEDAWSLDSPRMDLQSRCKQKADILGLDWKRIEENLSVIDVITYAELRDWWNFAQTYKCACEKRKIELVLFDSLTMLESYRGHLKTRLQEIASFNQLHGITAIFINQRAKEEWDVRGMAGGIGLGHILDSTLIIDYGRTYHEQVRMDLDVKRGVNVKIVRVLGCRLCGFDGRYKFAEITKDGFLKVK